MDAATFFYITAGIAIWIFVATGLLIAIQIYLTLTKIQKTIESTRNFAEGLRINQLSSMFSFYSIAQTFFKKFKGLKSSGGDK